MHHLKWGKSSYSGRMNSCVEVAAFDTTTQAVRDSKNSTGPALVFSAAQWSAFTTGVRAGQFD